MFDLKIETIPWPHPLQSPENYWNWRLWWLQFSSGVQDNHFSFFFKKSYSSRKTWWYYQRNHRPAARPSTVLCSDDAQHKFGQDSVSTAGWRSKACSVYQLWILRIRMQIVTKNISTGCNDRPTLRTAHTLWIILRKLLWYLKSYVDFSKRWVIKTPKKIRIWKYKNGTWSHTKNYQNRFTDGKDIEF